MSKKSNKRDKTFCPAPFKSVAVSASGTWTLCCESNTNYTHPGGHRHINETGTLEEWFNGDYMTSVRKSMLAGEPLKECEWCYKTEALGAQSLRQKFLEDEVLNADFDPERPTVEYLEIRFGNKCNLKCKMCFPHASSELAKEWRALGWHLEDPARDDRKEYYNGYMEADYDWPRDRNNIFKLLSAVGTTKLIKFTGGEPMLSPQMFSFMEHCVRHGLAPDIELHVITNCTKIHPRFLDLVRKFKRLTMTLSVDGLGRTYDYIRYPARWSQVEANILRYRSWYQSGLVRGKLGISAVLGVFNLHQMVELVRDAHRLTGDAGGVHPYDMDHPGFMSWRHAPIETQQRAMRDAVRLAHDTDPALASSGRRLCGILRRRNQVPTTESRAKLREFVTQQDGLRGIHIGDYIPHLVETMRVD